MDNPQSLPGTNSISIRPASGLPGSEPQAPPTTVQVVFDDSKTGADYVNFCRVIGSPEELFLDFGFNPQPVGVPTRPIEITQRVITGWHTAKRLLEVLRVTLMRHEAAFGVLETDIQARVRNK